MKIHDIHQFNNLHEVAVDILSSSVGSTVILSKTNRPASITVPCGHNLKATAMTHIDRVKFSEVEYLATEQQEDILARMIQSHKTGDFCLVGDKVDYLLSCFSYLHHFWVFCLSRELERKLL